MPRGPIPDDLSSLLNSDNVALLSTLGPRGEPHTTPIWFLWDGQEVLLSLIEEKQRYRNVQRDPRVSLAIIDRDSPTHYLEVRGTVDIIVDENDDVFASISRKYTGRVVSLEPEGTRRFVGRFAPEHYTFQRPIDFSTAGDETRTTTAQDA